MLDGGLPQWRASVYDVESSASSDAILKASAAGEAIEKVYQGQSVIYFIFLLFLLAVIQLYIATTQQESLILLLSYGVLIQYRYD